MARGPRAQLNAAEDPFAVRFLLQLTSAVPNGAGALRDTATSTSAGGLMS